MHFKRVYKSALSTCQHGINQRFLMNIHDAHNLRLSHASGGGVTEKSFSVLL